MAWDFKFDPVTQDLIDDGAGSFETVDTAETMVLHQMLCHYNTWWGDPELGSNLYKLATLQRDPRTLAELEVRRALNVIVKRGRILTPTITSERPTQGRVVTLAKFRDASTGQLVTTHARAGG